MRVSALTTTTLLRWSSPGSAISPRTQRAPPARSISPKWLVRLTHLVCLDLADLEGWSGSAEPAREPKPSPASPLN